MNAFQIWARSLGTLLFLLGFVSSSLAAIEDSSPASGLRLIPFPKSVASETGAFSVGGSLLFEVPDDQREVFEALLNAELQRAGFPKVQTKGSVAAVPAFRLAAGQRSKIPELAPQTNSESYALEIRTNEIVCAAREPAGLYYGLQTLCQLIRANRQKDRLPCLQIRDWPSLRWRCFQDDLTRGPASKLDTLKFEASLGSYLKFNLMTYYMEYQFAFKRHPKIGPPNGSLTPAELSALVAYAQPLHLQILGNQQSFGHFGQILKHTEYASLRETADVLTPVREETYQLLDDLYSEVCPLLPFPWFNVCCDETEGLGTGPSRELASSIGVGGVYVRHIRRVHDLLRDQHKKRMMMWGDIILQHPERLGEVPQDTIMLTWGYDARASFENQILPFAKSGYEFFVCPGVSDWSRILPDFGVAVTNIQNFVRDGARQGALGMLNTDWEDDGEALKAVKWHADAWAAECAWNASATSIEAFNRRVGAVLFGESGDAFGRAVDLLSQSHRLPGMKGMMNARFWENDFVPKGSPAAAGTTASNLLAIVRPALQHLENCRREAKCNQHILDVFRFGARRMELIAQRMLDGLEAAKLYEQVRTREAESAQLTNIERLLQRNIAAHELMGRDFAALWLAESKPYALDWTLARYSNLVSDYRGLLRKLEVAKAAASGGPSLPAAEEIGLAWPKPLFRCAPPALTSPAPLSPDLPWIEESATHRLGLVIQAGTLDRVDLPVEVELVLPPELASKLVRAFVISTNETRREVLAQLDSFGAEGKARLVLLLPGWLRHGQEAAVHVYLGLSQAPVRLPGAASTAPATNGMRLVENDQVRLLLGPEGAHVYRWELKAATNRDLTMPGESDWAGFSDMHPQRGSAYNLKCTARGPAMVEYQCDEASGQTKIIRLYGGVSWVEVLLNEPTSVYWDFDNPKNFAADGPTPGKWLFSNGQSGLVGREAAGVPAQVKAVNTYWGMKYNSERLALGLITPESAVLHVVAPGGGAGGVGIESSSPALHFVTFGGLLADSPAETMDRLHSTLDLKRKVEVHLHNLQAR